LPATIAALMETLCEHCRRECWIEDDRAGEEVSCPWCGKTFVAKEPPERLIAFASIVESLLSERESNAEELGASSPSSPTEMVARPVSGRARQRRRPARRIPRLAAALVLASAVAVGGSIAASRWYARAERAASTQAASGFLPWEPDPLLVDQLGKWKRFDRFEFCPPKSFTRLSVLSDPGWLPPDGHFSGLSFQGDNGDRAELFCYVVTFPPLVPMRGGLEQGLGRFYGWLGYHAALSNLSKGEPEVGELNGRKCIRSSFVCHLRRRDSLRGDPREGVVYVMLDNNRQVSFYTLCDPKLQDEHNLMAASLLTWREQ
jgi:DNA-directed RNA polymerase subunit RPC12/RpoP